MNKPIWYKIIVMNKHNELVKVIYKKSYKKALAKACEIREKHPKYHIDIEEVKSLWDV